jgi:hypothetical protein
MVHSSGFFLSRNAYVQLRRATLKAKRCARGIWHGYITYSNDWPGFSLSDIRGVRTDAPRYGYRCA